MSATMADHRRIKLAVVANELFAPEVGRMGGFGWAVRQVAECFQRDPSLGVDVVLLMGEPPAAGREPPTTVHGAPVIWPLGRLPSQVARVRRERPDLILSIDYRSSYRRFFYVLPRTRLLIWVRDPRTPADSERARTVRSPGLDAVPQGVTTPDTRTLREVATLAQVLRRPLLFGVTARDLGAKIPAAYAVKPDHVYFLPNIVEPAARGPIAKAARPIVVFLGRLDPIKRPWIFFGLAERLPNVQFVVMGQSHFETMGSWQPSAPPNVRLLGHADEQEKRAVLSEAWLLVNTSIHESLAVSFLEALSWEVPIIASVDPDNVVSRFGIHVRWSANSGLESLSDLVSAVRLLLNDHARRRALGAEGRRWVEATHSRDGFLRSFSEMVRDAGVALTAGLEASRAGRQPGVA
jgi:glycosyltransferase involved in cell wall biosynthesis